jgi:hypothetical protein
MKQRACQQKRHHIPGASDADRKRYRQAYSSKRRANTADKEVPATGVEKTERVSLGLSIFYNGHALPGACYTYDEIAAWAGCTDAAIMSIERRALRKLRKLSYGNPFLKETLASLFNRTA